MGFRKSDYLTKSPSCEEQCHIQFQELNDERLESNATNQRRPIIETDPTQTPVRFDDNNAASDTIGANGETRIYLSPVVRPILPEEGVCPICLETLCNGNPLVAPRCAHVMHEHCLQAWFRQNPHGGCPLCRTDATIPWEWFHDKNTREFKGLCLFPRQSL